MKLTASRPAVAAGFFAVAALGLAACSPPGEVDSTQKIDTATSQNPNSLPDAGSSSAATTRATSTQSSTASNVAEAESATATTTSASDELPVLSNCGQAGLVEPQRVILACEDQDDFIEDITWVQWTSQLAIGTGTRITVDPNRRVADTQIVLGSPEVVNGKLQFATVTVDGATINPESQLR
ncbi:hypothetical protein [Corynebacterium mayonis]|uniref:hypothetical protein n=1 Tax=Corynebacterium mayonis TaxID=3062461 RepID=UPI00314017FD